MITVLIKTAMRRSMIDVTDHLERSLAESGIQSGIITAYVPHTTAGLTINENADPDVVRDILVNLEKLVPESGDYRHAEGNSDAHIQASLMGSSVTIIVKENKLVLGTWQSVFFCEFDGPRTRKLHIQIIDVKN